MAAEQNSYEASVRSPSEAMDEAPAIQITDLVKTFRTRSSISSSIDFRRYIGIIRGKANGTVTALDGVNLGVQEGEVFGLLGPNGAGKTTLIKILSTLVLPDSGRASVYGIDVVKRPRDTVRMLQTVLAQATGFEFRLSGRRNLEFYADLYGIPRGEAKRRIDTLLEFSGLSDKANWSFQRYSTGMARRLLVCRALLSDVSLLIFDEPTSGLDPISAFKFRRFIREDLVRRGRKTIFLTTHNLAEAQELCNRVALIQKGKIIALGTPAQIRATATDKVYLTLVLDGRIGAHAAELTSRVRSIEGVFDLETQNIAENISLRIAAERQMNYNQLFESLLKMNARIISVESTEPSLEDAFLLLVEGRES